MRVSVVSKMFIPGVSFNFPMLGCITGLDGGPLSIRLVVIGPRGFVPRMGTLKTRAVGIRCRTYPRLRQIMRRVERTKVRPTIAVGPTAPMTLLRSVVQSMCVILIVDIGPKFNKRGFVRRSMRGIHRLHTLVRRANSGTLVRISNNIGLRANTHLIRTNTSTLMTNGTIFKTPSPRTVVRQLRRL